ncbi:DUF2637 domain-containing protein [Streptomyces sp. NPDC050400]|uniref:DUF2637 domain-containing protein n=1 Tax=Streptomyces sp. NPDC050400 TaxID=3365610 RepID=UPI0037A27CDE
MTMLEVPQKTAPDTPVSGPPRAVSDAAEFVSGTADGVSDADKRNPITTAEQPKRERLTLLLCVVAAVGGSLVGVIGFATSYSTLAKVALSWGFSETLAPWFPIGVDASILAFLALDLYLIRKDTPWPLLRLVAHGMTGATIWFNASSQGHISADPVQAASHGVMPLLFVIGIEAARRLFIKKTQLEAGTATDRIPLQRWILSPVATPRFYRRMRLHNVTSYPAMIRRQQELTGYEQWLKRKYDGDLSLASDDEKLPMTMAAHGYTVAQALAMPEQQEQAAEQRQEEAEQRRLDAETRREQARTKAAADRLRAQGELDRVRATEEAETGKVQAHAAAQVSAAQRASEVEQEALETALVAEAHARTAEALRKEAEEDALRAEAERDAALKRKEAAEADQIAAAESAAADSVKAAEDRKRAAEIDRAAAETEQAAAEALRTAAETQRRADMEAAQAEIAVAEAEAARERAAESAKAAAEKRLAAAEIEARAVEMEDAAKASPRERAVRKVARMALEAGAIPFGEFHDVRRSVTSALPLAAIEAALEVGSGTASEYRSEAINLLHGGYRAELTNSAT